MDSEGHYELALEGRVVVIRCVGTWHRQVALRLHDAVAELIERRLEPGVPWATLVDMSDWTPAGAEVVDVANQVRELVDGAGRAHGAYLFGSLEAAKLMIERSVIDPASKRIQYFQNEERARAWLGELGYLDRQASAP